MTIRSTLWLVGVVWLAPVAASAGHEIPVDVLLAAGPLEISASPGPTISQADILAVSPEMLAFVGDHVNPGASDVFKLQQLIDAIMDPEAFGLTYDEITRTASETFRTRHGNCLSFSAMFVALARQVGLSAQFEEVDIPPDWSMNEDVFVLSRHVNVRVDLGQGGIHVVDFNIGDFKTTYEIHTIGDRRAYAHFYNNLGVERMQDRDVAGAARMFRLAVEAQDDEFAPAWTNLGTLYRWNGQLDYAEGAYLQALRADKRNTVAMSNLVALYEKLGERDKAEVYRKRVEEHRMGNPYYRFWLAQDAFYDHDYATAIEHLKFATRRNRDEDRFVFLLGLCHLMQGDDAEARHCFARAEELAASDAQRKRYSTKIENLMAASAGGD